MELKSNQNMESKLRIEKTIKIGDITKSVCVEEVENGFIVTIDKYGYKGEGENREYYSECKKYISEKNPLEGETETKEESEKTGLLEALKSLDPKYI